MFSQHEETEESYVHLKPLSPWLPVSVLCVDSHLAGLKTHLIKTNSNRSENEMHAYCPAWSLSPPSLRLQPPALSNPLFLVQKLVGSPTPVCITGHHPSSLLSSSHSEGSVHSADDACAESFL